MSFIKKLDKRVNKSNSLLSVGLDPDLAKLPPVFLQDSRPFLKFNKAVIQATHDLVCAYKINSAMYEAAGSKGIEQLKLTCTFIIKNFPDIPLILDFKRGDIGNTNNYYAKFAFDYLGVDAITINPYMGHEANLPFLKYKDKGIMVLCRTSNPGAGEFQDLEFEGKKLYRIVAEEVMKSWNEKMNCLLVIGSPFPRELAELRQVLGDKVTFLIPGLGTQGGEAEKTVKAGINSHGTGAIINSSREVIYASIEDKFTDAVRSKAIAIRNQINDYR